MNSQEMMKCKAKPGYWWENVAKIDEQPDWREVPVPHNPIRNGEIFGQDERSFLARQYK